jgi:ferredoxin, 2Fe-2S
LTPTATVRVEPAGVDIEIRRGETLIQAAWRAGYHWPTLCYAVGTCTACQCEVLDGAHLVSPRTEAEETLLGDLNKRVRRINPRRVRLACQVTVTGDVRVRKPGVKIADAQQLQQTRTDEENTDVH